MKKTHQLITGLALASTVLFNTGCATLFSGSTSEIVLVNPPKDLKVYDNGQEVPIKQVFASAKSKTSYEGATTNTTYYASGVMVSKKVKHHKLTLESAGKKADVNMRTKVKGGIVFLDIVFTGFIGLPIDAATKKWRTIKSNHLDVPAIISGTEPKSQGQLKKMIRQQAEGKQ